MNTLCSFSLSQSHEMHSHDCGYIRRRALVLHVSEYRLSSSSSNTTRSLRVNDTTLTDEPTSDWLAMQSITEYSDNSTRRVPPLGFPPNEYSAVSVELRPTCTLARRHGTQCRSLVASSPLLLLVSIFESLATIFLHKTYVFSVLKNRCIHATNYTEVGK